MKTVLCYGDSNTWGYEPVSNGRLWRRERWPGILQEILGEQYRVIEDGLCGRTTGYDSELEPFMNGLAEAGKYEKMKWHFDIAAIMLGTNDCKDEYSAEPQMIVEKVKKVAQVFAVRGTKILLISPVPMKDLKHSPFYDEFGDGAEEKSKVLAKYYKTAAQEMGWSYFDAGSAASAGEYDGIHLDIKGHKELGKKISEQIRRMEEEYGR